MDDLEGVENDRHLRVESDFGQVVDFGCTHRYLYSICYTNDLLYDFQHIKDYYRVIKRCESAFQYEVLEKWHFLT